jgi:hypothetical protein
MLLMINAPPLLQLLSQWTDRESRHAADKLKTRERYSGEVSTSYPKGNGTNGKNCAQRRSKKPTLIEGVQYHKIA